MKLCACIGVGVLMLWALPQAWNNGPSGNATTNVASECASPPYATHAWIADHALDLLAAADKTGLVPHRAPYLRGTEAPNPKPTPVACGAPNTGYNDRGAGHSIEWNAGATEMLNDRAAVRAHEEYAKAMLAFQQGNLG